VFLLDGSTWSSDWLTFCNHRNQVVRYGESIDGSNTNHEGEPHYSYLNTYRIDTAVHIDTPSVLDGTDDIKVLLDATWRS